MAAGFHKNQTYQHTMYIGWATFRTI